MTNLVLIVAVLSIVFFIVALISHVYEYQKDTNTKYSFSNRFPYEFNDPFDPHRNITGNLSILVAVLLEIVFYLSVISTFSFSSGYLYFIVIAGIFVAICNLLLYFLPFRYLRAHIGVATGSFVLMIAFCISLVMDSAFTISDYATFMIDNNYTGEFYSCVISLVLSAIVEIILLIILLYVFMQKNPFKLEEVTLEDGSKEYRRPRRFAFAILEWSSIYSSFIMMISVVLFLFGAPTYLSL